MVMMSVLVVLLLSSLLVVPGSSVSCKIDKTSPCKCTYRESRGDTWGIDIIDYFLYPVFPKTDNPKYEYSYNCQNAPCPKDSFTTVVACQYVRTQDVDISLGVFNSDTTWEVTQTDPKHFQFVITYTGGLQGRVSATDADDKYEYSYTPCQPQVCGDSGEAASVICQVRTDTKVAFSIGRYDPFKWTITKFDPLEFEIQYGGGDKAGNQTRSSVVLFMKSSGSTKFTYEREGENLAYYFDVIGSGVGPQRGGGERSSGNIIGPIGLSITLLVLCGFVGYLVVGGIFMYTQRGARGMEVIPNFSFWRELPFLVKDGFFFTISPCYKRKDTYHGL